MNHEQAFLQAIREAPHDDAPRLIYADWLEEQGGAGRTTRADFIRIQCRLAELPDDDPARDTLEEEAANLLAEYEGEWAQPLHGIAADWRFSRGFVEGITIGASAFLTHAQRLFDFTPLRSLHLLIPPQDVPHLAACSHLQGIETLDFSGCHLNDRALQQLLTSPHLDRLRALNFEGNELNTPGIRALIGSPRFARLQCLDLSRNRGIGDTAVRLLTRKAPVNNLEVLRLGGTNLTLNGLYELFQSTSLPRLSDLTVGEVHFAWVESPSPPVSFANYPLLSQLRSLDVSEVHLPVLNLPAFLASLSAANLRALHLRSCFTENSDIELLAQSPALAKLTMLDMARGTLGASGMRTLAESPHLASLTHLDVSSNNLRDRGAKAIAESPHLRHLRVLNLAGNGIGGPGLKALAESANLDHLRTLRLSGNFIGADSVRILADSAHLRQLTWLDLSDAFLEEDSARALASSANLSQMRMLLLKKNLLGDGGAKTLAQSPYLARLVALDLNDNRIGKAGAEALAAASWRRMRSLDLRGNVFTDTQETLLRNRYGNAVQL